MQLLEGIISLIRINEVFNIFQSRLIHRASQRFFKTRKIQRSRLGQGAVKVKNDGFNLKGFVTHSVIVS